MTGNAARFRPGLETLERREVPAGNVTAVIQDGSLILTGDGEDNILEIRKGLDHGVRVVGMAGTAINGAVGLEDFHGAFKDVVLNLKAGDDVVTLAGGGAGTAADIGRDLLIKGGAGHDALIAESGATIGRDLVFRGGAGATSATLDGLVVGRHAQLSGTGNVQWQSTNQTTVNGLLSVVSPALADVVLENTTLGRLQVTADGQASVDIDNLFVGGNVAITGGSGADTIDMFLGSDILGNLTIQTRGGSDDVEVMAEVGGNVLIHLGGGASHDLEMDSTAVYGNLTILSPGNAVDNWDLDGVTVLGRTRLESGGGDDVLRLEDGEFFGRFDFLGGAGADQVHIGDGNPVTYRAPVLIDLGTGADTLTLSDGINLVEFLSRVTLQGGAGADTLNDLGGLFWEAPVIQSF
jgi:hypothetical protein